MNSNALKPNMSKFAVFIFAWGRPLFCDTYATLRKCGYTGRIVLLLDDLDPSRDEYIGKYGYEDTYVFSKSFVAKRSDPMNNFGKLESTLYVENTMFDIAKDLGIDYFCAMCDDYYYFGHRGEFGAKRTSRLDDVFEVFVEYLINSPVKCIAFCQGGDNMGGFDETKTCKRKAMNSFICKTNEPFKFYGSMNDDVNMYVQNGIRGDIILTYLRFQLDQGDSQSEDGGLTDLYKTYGTYVKSFYTIMISPSSVRCRLMGESSMRLHHSISYKNTVPCIIDEKYRKA